MTGSTIEADAAFFIADGAGRVRITNGSLSASDNSDIDISGDIQIRHNALSLETQASATFLTLATDGGTIDVAASRLSAQADSFGLITLIAPERLSLRSSELIAASVELLPQSGADLAFANSQVSAASPGSVDPAVVSLDAGSDPGAVMVVANTFAGGATFQFELGVQADRCTRANDPPDAVVRAEDACL